VSRATRISISLGVAALLLAGSAAAGAGELKASPLFGPDFRVSGPEATREDWHPAVAWNQEASQYLVVWTDGRNYDTRGLDIYGQRVALDGRPVGRDFRISGRKLASDEMNPEVVWNQEDNQYLVVWEDGRNYDTRGLDIYGRRVGSDGKPIGAEIRISGRKLASDEVKPAVAWNQEDNQYLVVWTDGRNWETRGDDIYGRRVGSDGKPVGRDFRITKGRTISHEGTPEVVWSQATKQYLVVWTDGRNQELRGYDIYGRRVGSDGRPVGADIRISGPKATTEDWSPAVAWNPAANQYLVVWTDGRNWETSEDDIYGRRLGSDGRPIGGDFRISSRKEESATEPDVAWNQANLQYLVVWEDWRNWETRFSDIYGQRVRV